MNRLLMMLVLCIPLFPISANAQYWIDNSEGVSVAAMGRGNAGIAVAGDPAGVWHNPAGLAWITESQVSLAGDYGSIDERYHRIAEGQNDSFISRQEIRSHSEDGTWSGISYISAVKPLTIGERHMILQAGYRRLVAFPDWKGSWVEINERREPDGTISSHTEAEHSWNKETRGGVDDWGMACAIKPESWLGLGLNLHFLNADHGNTSVSGPTGNHAASSRIKRDYAFSGLLWDVGILAQVLPAFSVGATYRSGLDSGLDYRWSRGWPDEEYPNYQELTDHTGIHWPDGYALGISWTPSATWLVALDYSRMNWSKSTMDRYFYNNGFEYEDIAYPTFAHCQWDADSWRLGGEYRIPSSARAQWTLRAGYFRQGQMLNQMADWGIAAEQPIYHGCTTGAGFQFGKTKWDLAVVYSRGREEAAWEEIIYDMWGTLMKYDNSMKSHSTRILVSGTILLE